MSIIFLRLEFFPEWVGLIRRTTSRVRHGHKSSTSSSSNHSDFFIHLHLPSRDFVDIKTTPLESPYRSNGFRLPKLQLDLHPPHHTLSDSKSSIFSEPPRPESIRPGSARPSSSRPGSQRSTLTKKDRPKKLSVEDILAMRRLEQSSEQGTREYPGIQPTKLTRATGGSDEIWPTYRFGEERNN